MTQAYQFGALGLIALALAIIGYQFGQVPPVTRTELGLRGLKRQRALEEGLFRWIEPLVRVFAAWLAYLPLHGLRARAENQLKLSGSYLGLTPNEYIALSILSGLFFLSIALVIVNAMDLPPAFTFLFTGLGISLPHSRVTNEVKRRGSGVERALPGAIDLAALCMGAGLDFPASVKQVVATTPPDDPLAEELSRVLQELDLGRTRRQALESFADRVPTPVVRDFVGSVVQAEEKGNPLAQVLKIQATVLRLRRSTMLEERAARAGVLMMGPLILMMLSVMVILMGPLAVELFEQFKD